MASEVREGRTLPIFIHAELDDFGLDPYTFRIYAHLARRSGTSRGAFEGVRKIAEHCRMGERQVQRALKTLRQAGMLSREVRPGKTSVYRLTDPDKWTQPVASQSPRTRSLSVTPPVASQSPPFPINHEGKQEKVVNARARANGYDNQKIEGLDEAEEGERENHRPTAPPAAVAPVIQTPSQIYSEVRGKIVSILERELIEAQVPDDEAPEFKSWLAGYRASYGINGVAKTLGIYCEQRDKQRAKEQEQRRGRLPGTPFVYKGTPAQINDSHTPLPAALAAGNGRRSDGGVDACTPANPRRRAAPLIPISTWIENYESYRPFIDSGRDIASLGEASDGDGLECPF